MVRRAAFWLFLVLLAVGFGWAANEQWRLPFLGLFNWQADQREALPEPEPKSDPDAGPGPEAPDSVVAAIPEPTGPEPTGPEPTGPEPTGLERTGPERTGPETAVPQPTATEPTPPAPTVTAPGAPASSAAGSGPAGPPARADAPADLARAPESELPSPPPETAVVAVEPADSPTSATDPAPPTGDAAPAAAPESRGSVPPSTAAAPQEDTGQASRQAETGQAGDVAGGVAPAAGLTEMASEPARGAQDAAQQSVAAIQEQLLPGAQAAIAPTFDIVRVERDGRAVIAGRAEPGAEVVVRSGEQVIDRVRASRRGDWVAIPTRPLSPGDQQLSAVATREGAPAIRSEQVVVVAVSEQPRPQPAPEDAVAAEPPVAVLLPRDGKGPGRVLQAPGRLSAEDTLALMTVSYDESGKVLLSGEAPPGVPVRIYVDNRPAALVVGDVKGAWASGLGDTLAPGTYTLRLDQLDAQGQPVARIETPFTRVSDPPVEGELQVDYVVVQPGNSLWRIARRLSGSGLDYVHIYDTNQSQIRDPDLIYPGQVFEIPAEIGPAG